MVPSVMVYPNNRASVVGPYASVNCTLSLQTSSLRVSPLLANGVYARNAGHDIRFVDYFGATDVIVTSGAANDSGLFETSLHDERFTDAGVVRLG
jgi:hypothetical protein